MDYKNVSAFLRRLLVGEEVLAGSLVLTTAALAGGAFYGYHTLETRIHKLDTQLASTTALLESAIAEATNTFSSALQEESRNLKEQLGDFEEQVEDVSDTVGTLEKLSKTDPELLAKYSKVFFLSENYAPARLVEIPPEYEYFEERTMQVIPEVLPFLTRMLDRAKKDGITLYVYSAYRSFDTQGALKGQYTVTYGAGTANQFSADQGYSEHQLGTTVDFITTGIGGSLDSFGRTEAFAWLQENAYRYGFVLSYPAGNKYYVYEPWHWRFVGKDLARDLKDDGKNFYDLDQRAIDTYLISIFD